MSSHRLAKHLQHSIVRGPQSEQTHVGALMELTARRRGCSVIQSGGVGHKMHGPETEPTILIVGDKATICVELQGTLQRFGYHVERAHCFESTLGSIREARFDPILLAFNLTSECGVHPRTVGGIRLSRDLRKSGTTIPILVYTVMEGETYKAASLDAHADDFTRRRHRSPTSFRFFVSTSS